MKRITAPVEIAIPPSLDVIDHGMVLVHELGGNPRNWLHEVSVRRWQQDSIRFLEAAGYIQHHGWVRDGEAFWIYTKPYPLSVLAWTLDGAEFGNDEALEVVR
jgi:hypothetical protein